MTYAQDFIEVTMPLIKISSSGSDFNIRINRDNLNNRNKRRMDVPPNSILPPKAAMIISKTHVSMTIMKTRQESNTNQPSFRPLRFLLKDMKRTIHSKVKYTQKECSMN